MQSIPFVLVVAAMVASLPAIEIAHVREQRPHASHCRHLDQDLLAAPQEGRLGARKE